MERGLGRFAAGGTAEIAGVFAVSLLLVLRSRSPKALAGMESHVSQRGRDVGHPGNMEASLTRELLRRKCATHRAAHPGPSATMKMSLQDDKVFL